MFQKYPVNSLVYSFYFDFKSGELLYKKLIVSGYSYLDKCCSHVIDEYLCIEESTKTKYLFFNKKIFIIHHIHSHLLSDKIEFSKIKFLYHFLTSFNFEDSANISNELFVMYNRAKIEYSRIFNESPEMILQALTDKITSYDHFNNFWR